MEEELKRMEGYVKELEAIRHYPKVKERRDSLAAEAARLKEKVEELKGQLNTEVSRNNEVSSELSKKEAKIRELASGLDEARGELSSLTDFKVKLRNGDELTLEEMRTRFLQAEEDEMEKRVKERLKQLEKDIKREMPTLIHKRLIQLLRRSSWPPEIERVIDSRARKVADRVLGDRGKWPEWFKTYYLDQVRDSVSVGLDSEFEGRVQREAEKKLEAMKASCWRAYVGEKAEVLSASLKGLVNELQGTWWFACDRCARRLPLEISPSEVGVLLRGEAIDVVCAACSDPAPFPFILSTVSHRVGSLTLENLVQLYIGKLPPPQGLG